MGGIVLFCSVLFCFADWCMGVQTRTEVVQKIDIELNESVDRSRLGKSPWRGDFLGTQVWAEGDQQLLTFPARPPPVVGNTKRSGSV